MAEESHLYKVVKKLPPGAFKSLLEGMERIFFSVSFVKIFTFDKQNRLYYTCYVGISKRKDTLIVDILNV